MPVGRPTDYSDELAVKICERIAGGESVKDICADTDMPARSSVYLWLAAHKTFSDMYARAKEECADLIFEEILSIADDARNDWMERNGEDDAGWQANGEHIQRSKLRIDARKWIAAKLKPKSYGERIHNEHSGPDGGPIQTQSVNDLTDDELARIATTGRK